MFRYFLSCSKAVIIAALLLQAVGCEKMDAPSPSNTYALDESELKAKLSKAETGDVEAMNELVSYYWIYEENGQERGLYWLKRAAIAGDADAKKSYFDYCEEHISKSKDVCEKSVKE